MKNVYMSLLTTHSSGATSDKDLFEVAVAINKGTTLHVSNPDSETTDAQRASKRQGRELAFGFCQMLKTTKTSDGLKFTFPNGTTQPLVDKTTASAYVVANFDTLYPAIL